MDKFLFRNGKKPKQSRSKKTVEAILEAAAQILSDRGLAGFNTNRVAERAGVSIGTLYQYFPNKQALLRALMGQLSEALQSNAPAATAADNLTLPERIRTSVKWHLSIGQDDPQFFCILQTIAPSVLSAEEMAAVERLRTQNTLTGLRKHTDALPNRDLDTLALVVSTCLSALSQATLRERSQGRDTSEIEREVTRLLSAYLEAEPVRAEHA